MYGRDRDSNSFLDIASMVAGLNTFSLVFKVDDNKNKYKKFLIETRQFVSVVSSRIIKAETLKHMCEAVPIETLKTLTDDIRSILIELRNLKRAFEDTRYQSMPIETLRGNPHQAHLAGLVDKILDNVIVKIGEKIEKNLLTIGQEQAKIKGKHLGLNKLSQMSSREQEIVRDQKKELMDILQKTQAEVDKGLEIIRNC